jgi:hypothetical protein
VFTIGYRLLASGELTVEEAERIKTILAWFDANLPEPDPMHISSYHIFWFKVEAQECIQRMWELADLLRVHGYLVTIEKCQWPGAVIYQDEFQAAAQPLQYRRKK